MVPKGKSPDRKRNRVTMKTIAEEAGVTLTTVSRILNNKIDKNTYAAETRDRIISIANRLKYRPNALVLGMQTGQTGIAGVMMPVAGFYGGIIDGIHDVFVNNNTIMLLSWNNRSHNDREEKLERQIIHQMVDRRVQGIILRPSSEDFERSYFEEIWERDIPLILIDRHLSNIDTDFVGTDDIAGGRAAAEYLIGLGHRRFLFVGVGLSASTSRDREEGFRRVLSEYSTAFWKSLYYKPETFEDNLVQILRSSEAPTAIFCYSDALARKSLKCVTQAGFSVPRDLSIIGFGNESMKDGTIALTTFDQFTFLIGQSAAQMYLERINETEKNGVRTRIITPELIIRGTTAPPLR